MCFTWIILFFIFQVDASVRGGSGPYRNVLISAHRCPKTQYSMEKNPTIILFLEAYNNTNNVTVLGGNFTVLRDTSQLKGKGKQYRWINGKWKSNLVLRNGACDGIFISIFISFFGGKHDPTKCSVPKGQYHFEDVDVNKVTHLWAPTLDYGKQLWKIEVTSPTGLVDCWEFIDIVIPD